MATGNPVRFKVEGLAELREALLQYPQELHKGPLKKAVRNGVRVARDAARMKVPILKSSDPAVLKRRKPGTLRNAIRIGWSKLDSSSVQETWNVFVKGLSRGKISRFKTQTGRNARLNPDDPYYWKVWEFGNGINNSKPFLRPAFEETKVRQVEVLRSTLAKDIGPTADKVRARTSRGR